MNCKNTPLLLVQLYVFANKINKNTKHILDKKKSYRIPTPHNVSAVVDPATLVYFFFFGIVLRTDLIFLCVCRQRSAYHTMMIHLGTGNPPLQERIGEGRVLETFGHILERSWKLLRFSIILVFSNAQTA